MSENNGIKEPLNKNNKVPKLRFDRFKNDNFNCDILSQIATLSKGNGLSKDELSSNGNKCILYGELYTRYLGYIDTIISKTKTILSKPKLSKSGDIIMPLSGETPTDISNSAVVPEDNVILGGDLLVITPKKNIDPLFLSLYLSNCKKKEIAKKTCGISIIHSHKEDIAKLTINYPSLAEQYYISNFLRELTKKTDIVLKKIDILKKYKEGVFRMIQINASNCIKLGDFCDLYQPKTIAQSLLKINGKYPVYGANGIIGYYNNYNHETSQVIVGCRGNCGAIQLTNNKSWINGNAMVIKPLNNIKLIYLYYLMHTIRFDKIIEKSSVPQITRDKMKTIKIPANFDNRILDMLIFLDKKIELLQKEVKVLIKIKLQLLNILFI